MKLAPLCTALVMPKKLETLAGSVTVAHSLRLVNFRPQTARFYSCPESVGKGTLTESHPS